MKNNFVTIMNTANFPVTIPVDNFSDDNVKHAISAALNIKTEELQCLTQGNPVIYGVKTKHPVTLMSVNVFFSMHPNPYAHFVHILYSIIVS